MKKIFKSLLMLIVLGSVLPACSKKQEQAPPPEVAAPAPKLPEEPAAPPQVQAPAAASFDGEWSGSSGEDLPVSFSIQNNQVTSFNGSYAGRNGTCSFNGNFGSEAPAAIQDKSFATKGTSPRDPIYFTAKGTLTSPTEASGTLVWTGKSELCGDINLNYQWTAKKSVGESEDSLE